MKFTYIYKRWKRDVRSPLVPNLGPWFNAEGSQLLAQSSHHALLELLQEMAGLVDHFRVMPQPQFQPLISTSFLLWSLVSDFSSLTHN